MKIESVWPQHLMELRSWTWSKGVYCTQSKAMKAQVLHAVSLLMARCLQVVDRMEEFCCSRCNYKRMHIELSEYFV